MSSNKALDLAFVPDSFSEEEHREMDSRMMEETPDMESQRDAKLLLLIIGDCPTLSEKFTKRDAREALLEKYPEISMLLNEARREGKFRKIRLLGLISLSYTAIIDLPCFVLAILQKDKPGKTSADAGNDAKIARLRMNMSEFECT